MFYQRDLLSTTLSGAFHNNKSKSRAKPQRHEEERARLAFEITGLCSAKYDIALIVLDFRRTIKDLAPAEPTQRRSTSSARVSAAASTSPGRTTSSLRCQRLRSMCQPAHGAKSQVSAHLTRRRKYTKEDRRFARIWLSVCFYED